MDRVHPSWLEQVDFSEGLFLFFLLSLFLTVVFLFLLSFLLGPVKTFLKHNNMEYEYKPRKVGQTTAFVAALYSSLIQQGYTSILACKQDERQINRYKEILKKSYGFRCIE